VGIGESTGTEGVCFVISTTIWHGTVLTADAAGTKAWVVRMKSMKLRFASPMLSAGCTVDEVVYYVAYRVFRYMWLTGSMHGEERKILSSRNVRIDVSRIFARSGLSAMDGSD
jgi:hypothetical protein